MGILYLTAAALALLGTTIAAPLEHMVVRADKPCDADTKICYSEATAGGISYRIAIPDDAKSGTPFDILLSMTAPKATGWAGMAWGGAMANNPLTVGWANGKSAMVTSRRATGHTMPQEYADAKYTILPGSATNDTHWRLDVLCTGCSSWKDASGGAKNLDPASTSVQFAFASSAQAPADPSSSSSRFGIHNAKGKWTHDLAAAKLADFANLVKAYQAKQPAAL